MELRGECRIGAPPARVFAALCDETVLMRCIGPLESVVRRSETAFDACLRLRLGPFAMRIRGRVTIEPAGEAGRYRVSGTGDGPMGLVRADLDLSLQDRDDDTHLTYHLAANLGALAGASIRAKAEKHVRKFFEAFGGVVTGSDYPQISVNT